MTCEQCHDRMATAHVTTVKGGVQQTHHLCGPCAVGQGLLKAGDAAMIDLPSMDRVAMRAAQMYRALAQFMRDEGRMPHEWEARKLGWTRGSVPVLPEGRRIERYIALFDWVAAYNEEHKRHPGPDQILAWADSAHPAPE